MSELPVLSVIIVDFFKAPRVIENVKAALLQKGNFEIEVIVIDNSCDLRNRNILQELDGLPSVTIVFNYANKGYVDACNQAFYLCRGDYVFLVNPDITWKSSSVLSRVVATFSSNHDIGIVGVRQENDDGTTPETVRSFPDIVTQIARRTFIRNLPWFKSQVKEYELANFDYSVSADVDWIQSSFMAVKRDVWNGVNGLDSRFFLFMADPDICYQTWLKGYRVFYQADVLVGADGKRCSAGGFKEVFFSQALRFHIRDAFIYQLKYLFKPKILSREFYDKLT